MIMKQLQCIIISLIFLFSCNVELERKDDSFRKIMVEYPESRKDSVADNYHGTEVDDPYRWLEDDRSEETSDWVKRQNAVTGDYLEQIPFRKEVEKRLSELWNYEKYGSPFRKGEKYYYFHNSGLQNQSVLYGQESLEGDGKVVLDPNEFSEDGTVALSSIAFDQDGQRLAYVISDAGSDWQTIRVRDLQSGKDLKDEISWVKFSSVAWDGDGFYYSRFPEPSQGSELAGQNQYHKLYYHKMGTSQDADLLIKQDSENPSRLFFAGTTEDERFLYVSESESSSGNQLHIKNLDQKSEFRTVTNSFDFDVEVVGNQENVIYVKTTEGASRGKLIAIDWNNDMQENTILPEQENVLVGVHLLGGRIFAEYLRKASSAVLVYDMEGNYIDELTLPTLGSVSQIRGSMDDDLAFYSFTSYTYPTTIFSLDVKTLESKVFKKPQLDFDPESYQTQQVFYNSKDGTEVSMFITSKKNLAKTGDRPALLYGYGGFNISLSPSFSITNLILLENDGIYAVPNLRGGGEYGKEWHKAGTKERKQNVFDDFIAAAEYLIAEKYTSSEKLAIMGGSNGGLLVGACMTQRPDLFSVAIPRVGVLDMLRYHQFTIGWAWAEDYGRSDNPDAFDYLIKYSPLHNVRNVAYPSTLVMTADHDDRVVPAHSFKFAATLQEHQQGDSPVLIRIEESAGHGAGKPTSKLIEESADMLSFMLYNLQESIAYKNMDS